MKKVLIIAYYFPPIGGGGVQRALKMAKYLGEFGWEPHVLTVEPVAHVSLDETLLKQLPDSVHIHRCREWPLVPGKLARKALAPAAVSASSGSGASGARNDRAPRSAGTGHTPAAAVQAVPSGASGGKPGAGGGGGRSGESGGGTSRGSGGAKQRLFSLLKRAKNALLIPDDQIVWLVPAIRKGREIVRDQDIDVMVSTSGPVTDHLVGLALKRSTGIPWIADFRDPWTQNMHRSGIRWREWLEERLERMVLRESDVLLTVTNAFARNFRNKFASEIRRIEVIHNGFDRADYAGLADVTKPEAERDRCVFAYTGIFYKERNPRLFLRAVRDLIDEGKIDPGRILLRFAGVFDYPGYSDNADFVRENRLEHVVEVLGHLPHAQALKTLKQADVLLLVGDTAPGSGDYIPGKLFEYMAIGHPILALSLPGESTHIIETYRLGVVADPLDLEAVKQAVYRMYRQWLDRKEAKDRLEESREDLSADDTSRPSSAIYERREQARMLAALMDELLAEKRGAQQG